MTLDPQVQVCPGYAAALAEGIYWDPQRQRLFWVDILHPWLYWFDPASLVSGRLPLPQAGCWLIGSRTSSLLIGMTRSIGLLDPETGKVSELQSASLHNEPEGNRLNDGGADFMGRLWFGTMDHAEQAPSGQLYRFDLRGVQAVDTGYVVTNGPVFSSDMRYMFHTSSTNREIYRFNLSASGELTDKQIFIRFSEADGFPDGMAFDTEGCLWVAHWGGGKISRFDRDGCLLRSIALPVLNVTNVAFGGTDLRYLYVTTASVGLSSAALQQQPMAGRLFMIDLGLRGASVPQVDLSQLNLSDI